MDSIATGNNLTKKTWAEFVRRLRHDVRGKGANNHCTSDAIFIVQSLEHSQYFCWGYKELINAILIGKLVFTGE